MERIESKNDSAYISIDNKDQDKLRPQKMSKLESDEASGSSLIPHTLTAIRKSNNSYDDSKEDRNSSISDTGNKELEEFSSGGSKVAVSLVNAELWKEICKIGNEMWVCCFKPR